MKKKKKLNVKISPDGTLIFYDKKRNFTPPLPLSPKREGTPPRKEIEKQRLMQLVDPFYQINSFH
jgi:hypothetical protein